nr:zinc finger protein RFP-like [Anolis sagrei ordinatus]
MAAESILEEFSDETTCTICLECFRDPVTIDCGHNFCQACLSQYWEEAVGKEVSCPQCRETIQQKQFRPNRQLANVANLVKKLQKKKDLEARMGMCEKHQGLLSLFCKDDGAPICIVCKKFMHRNHNVVPVEEAVQSYKDEFKVFLERLKKEKETLKRLKTLEELRRQDFRKMLEQEYKKARIAFDKMRQFLEENQRLWMVHLEEMVKETEKRSDENVTKLSEGISQVCRLTAEIEERCEQPENKFLQNVKKALDRSQEDIEEYIRDISSKLEERLKFACLKNSILENAVQNYKEYVDKALSPAILERTLDADNLKKLANKVCVTLDPDTAHPYLNLSEDQKVVTWESKKKKREYLKKTMPNNPERFSWETCALGSQKFTSGIHWWVVETLGLGSWAIGVARESMKRKGVLQLSPEEGVWSLRKPFRGAAYFACEILAVVLPEPIVLTLTQEPTKILVALDYEGGRVDFFDGDTNGFIFSFHIEPLSGEALRPFFELREWGFSLQCLS